MFGIGGVGCGDWRMVFCSLVCKIGEGIVVSSSLLLVSAWWGGVGAVWWGRGRGQKLCFFRYSFMASVMTCLGVLIPFLRWMSHTMSLSAIELQIEASSFVSASDIILSMSRAICFGVRVSTYWFSSGSIFGNTNFFRDAADILAKISSVSGSGWPKKLLYWP